jgi:hypothetical protein
VPKLEGNISIEKEKDLRSSSTPSISFTNRNRGKSLCLNNPTTNPTPTTPAANANPTTPAPPPPIYEIHQQDPPQYGTTDLKSPLTDNLQLVPWPPQYRSTSPPKYHGDTDPLKFPMCYEAAIASAGGDNTTLAKSLIISLEGTIGNCYSRLQPRCIYSW